MYETTTSKHIQEAIQRGRKERAAVLREAIRWLTRSSKQKKAAPDRRGLFCFYDRLT
jgi:site-specific recombinase